MRGARRWARRRRQEGGEAAFWHHQIPDAGKVERDWRKRAEQLIRR